MSERNTTLEASPIRLTEGAYNEILKLMNEKDIPDDHALRIGVKGGGCSGLSYILGFDSSKEEDITYAFRDLKIIIEKPHTMYVAGMEIDYVDGLNNRGFTFSNPNATSTCGCGSSFSA